jgi:hypothetical protein
MAFVIEVFDELIKVFRYHYHHLNGYCKNEILLLSDLSYLVFILPLFYN